VAAHECLEYGPPFSDNLTIPKDVLEKEKILKLEVGYAFLSKAWGRGYAPEAMKAFVEVYLKPRGFWNPPFERVYLHGITGGVNARSRRVLEKIGFKLNGIHKWDGPEVFIGGAMQPPEVCVFSLGPSAGSSDSP
jgi:RimJ/RimL family protein N-acetyltransferase